MAWCLLRCLLLYLALIGYLVVVDGVSCAICGVVWFVCGGFVRVGVSFLFCLFV